MKTTSKKRKLLYGLGILYLTLSVVYFSLSFYVNHQLNARQSVLNINHCSKIWATRGLNTQNDGQFENTNNIEAVNRAFAEGAVGTEIDIYFDHQRQDFIVSHDYPYNLKKGRILTLTELLRATGRQGYFWLDFKSMRHLSEADVKTATKKLRDLVTLYSVNDAIYIEGHDPINLAYFRDAGFNTIFDTHPPPDHWPFTSFVMNVYKMVYYFGDHTVMGVEYDEIDQPVYGPDTAKATQNVPLFVYHVPNNRQLLKQLSQQDNIQVILDIDDSASVFDINACQP